MREIEDCVNPFFFVAQSRFPMIYIATKLNRQKVQCQQSIDRKYRVYYNVYRSHSFTEYVIYIYMYIIWKATVETTEVNASSRKPPFPMYPLFVESSTFFAIATFGATDELPRFFPGDR